MAPYVPSRMASLFRCSIPFASRLLEVRIENLSKSNQASFDVDVILDACPMSLTIKNILVSQRSLDTMTGASPNLVKMELFSLHLVQVSTDTGKVNVEPMGRIEFFYHIGRSCPQLELAQVSLFGDLLGANEMDSFRSTFATAPNWSFSKDDFYNEGLMDFLLPRRPTELQAMTLSCLRGLEVHPKGNYVGIHKALHAYLVSPRATALVHLNIMGINHLLSYSESGFLTAENAWTHGIFLTVSS
ncbi:hypothetical protein BG015_000767 [Linnemannia schmuckeri]|uniref:Uncharacterized protein n=1 Tax=Linnemannia schmuckeri TaxID=64567 RepID=A0A9P5RQP0_9FUNG|nr:hypothetical protein BG015_000767 [Linnemannia schmuckeri]